MNVSTHLVAIVGACLALAAARTSADEPLTSAPREIAADGTVSVVVDPPQAPPRTKPDAEGAEAGAADAAVLLDKALEPFDASAPPDLQSLHERPLTLLEALERAGDPARRLWITQAYWKVVAAFAGLRQATHAIDRLELVAPGAAQQDRSVLDALVAERRSEQATARAALVAAQQELVDLARLPVGESLPWPVDRPLTTPYQTHFDTIFAARMATGRVRAINRTIPLRHEGIESRADAVRAATTALTVAETEHAQGRLSIDAVATAAERLEAQERKFIEDVRQYNNDIAEYVMAVADFSVPNDRFAAMLIGTPTPWRQQPVVVPAGVTTDAVPSSPAASPNGPVQPSIPVPPPAFIPQAPLQAAPPAIPVVP